MAKQRKILILVPSGKSQGGVSHYFSVIKPFFTTHITYFYRGVRQQQSSISRVVYPLVHIYDILRFILYLSIGNYSLVHFNTSFGLSGLFRDSVFILITRLLKMKYIVFFRGIDHTVIFKIENKFLYFFRGTFLKADAILVLSTKLKNKIQELGYKGEVILETTVVDSELLKEFDINKKCQNYDDQKPFILLFLSRLEKEKGIFETIEAFKVIHKKYTNTVLNICGDGKERRNVLNFIGDDINRSIFFKGYVTGKEKVEAYANAVVYICPSYAEGMPNALLEALAFGLPIITSNVGGIPDFFIHNKMGYMINSVDPDVLTDCIEKLIINPLIIREISKYNYEYAHSKFLPEKVINRLEETYLRVINV
jgi:glycosyltransferase involved in cell wall biosynthesis